MSLDLDFMNEDNIYEDDDNYDINEKYLTFYLENEIFGININNIIEIVKATGITPVPEFPDFAKGIIDFRGSITPIIDLRIRFKKSETDYSENTCIIIVNIDDKYYGFVVDSVSDILVLEGHEIMEPPTIAEHYINRFITGIVKIEERLVILLDPTKILKENEINNIKNK